MAEESRMRKNSALQELKRLQQEDRAAGIHYDEPELRHFDAQSVFDTNKKQEKPVRKNAFHLAKRTQKAQHVEVYKQALENEKFQVEDLSIQPKKKKRKTLKRSQAKLLDQQESNEVPTVEETKEELTPENDVLTKTDDIQELDQTSVESTAIVETENQSSNIESGEAEIEMIEPIQLGQEDLEQAPDFEPVDIEQDSSFENNETVELEAPIIEPVEPEQIVQPGLDQEEDIDIQVQDLTEDRVEEIPEVEEEISEEELEQLQLEAFKARQVEELKKSLASAALEEKENSKIEAQQVDEVEDIVRPIEALSFEGNSEEEKEEVKEDLEPKSVKETFEEMKRNSEELSSSLKKKDIAEEEEKLEDEDPMLHPQDAPDEVIEFEEDELDELQTQTESVGPSEGDANEEEAFDEDDIRVEFFDEEAKVEEQSKVSKKNETEEVEEEIPLSDLYEEKKHFLLSEYTMEEDYLEEQSQMGYHFVKSAGKKFYFRKGDPCDYYYVINYYEQEPDQQTKLKWKQEGWKLLSVSESKKKKDAGWFILRNEEKAGEYRKKIDNEEEKFAFFKKYRSSCRSTLFMIFVCMVACAVCFGTQVWSQTWKGANLYLLIALPLSLILFLVCFGVFISYSRMLRGANKQANLLKARLRLKERKMAEADRSKTETDEELDNEWEKFERE